MELSEFRLRPMSEEDIGAGMRLKELAGWNQVEADWQGFLEIEPTGCFVGELDGEVVTTGTAFNFANRFGWIGMILVDPGYRRQGIATRMMKHMISYLDAKGCCCLKLDATDAGAKVYSRMGFQTEYQVERWFLNRAEFHLSPSPDETEIVYLSKQHLQAIEDLDVSAFGASRKRLLKRYLNKGRFSFAHGEPTYPKGFVLGRPGSNAHQVGPLVAQTPEIARSLLQAALVATAGTPVIVDIPVVNSHIVGLLEEYGFERKRTLNRMYRGDNLYPGQPEQIFCLAGFEFG